MGSDSEADKSSLKVKKKKMQALAPIAKPLAGKKLCKNTLKLVRKDKFEKAGKKKRNDRLLSKKRSKLMDIKSESVADEVYHISKGIKKWVTEYHQSRPGFEILQQRIDEFITCQEARKEQEKQEREAHAAEGGWTVVVHHKGRKKTTDTESGIAVGSVAQAAVIHKMAEKKNKEVGMGFYRFQRKEAQRNEIMSLQNKFELDRKMIQLLRAARKFRPY